jgi:metal-responsive CopG/Arc/MetJ family transcriptional regulator
MPKDRTKKLITFDNDLIEQIDDYRFNNRLESRSEAVRQLIKAGLKKKAKPTKKKK